jgi:hypothetical protein
MTSAAGRWARSGLALLTGDAAPLFPRRDYAGRLEGLAGQAGLDMRVFGERAAELGLGRRGQVSANGAARLIEASDGWLAVNLARPDDVEAVPAWIGCALDDDPWAALKAAARLRSASDLAEAGQELGVPCAVVGSAGDRQQQARGPEPGHRLTRLAAGRGEAIRRPLVIDLSSLWAGPLCAQRLGLAGARVVKVESAGRPDAARQGPRAFFDRLHAGHESVVLDFTTAEGRGQLSRLVARADLVIEASRPRALEQLGIEPEAAFAGNPGLVWVSLTAYGRTGPWRDRVGFGDDTAAAAGLVAWDAAGRPMFVGDALADPVAGAMAAAAALQALADGGGMLVDVALREAAALIAAADPTPEGQWGEAVGGEGAWRWADAPIALPSARPPTGPAAAMGAHTRAILAELA